MSLDDYDVIALCVGPALTADELAQITNIAIGNPDAALALFSSAWDKDPRDLWQIPEAVEAWTTFGALADAFNFRGRLVDESRGILELCEAVTDGKRLERQGDQVLIHDPD